ncbi:hypothetical protein [Amylibacter sp. IMCC11727]|uniref:COG3904 family protein n=1 Tax=Amylibacter sp. IMCC11727 TaxID=3039851 RepID=UPI00244DC814|nr:hypothetical protein [Amylibacter sp. IMCC11727]WGI22395.1 hypothetical protein QBD29_02975 [Amylibacter sp. IMCC11727]
MIQKYVQKKPLALLNLLALVLLSLFSSTAAVEAKSWNDAIKAVSLEAERYKAFAHKNDITWAGVLYNGYKVKEHSCAILGRMLGKQNEVEALESFEYPQLNESTNPELAHDMLVFSISLENWVENARRLVGTPQTERVSEWNLDCIGNFGISLSSFIRGGLNEALFDFDIDSKTLTVFGPVDVGFYHRFKSQILLHQGVEIVSLGSGGGSVADAIFAGKLIRSLGIVTEIHSNCYSACPLIYAGGIERRMWASNARLGFHQVYNEMGPVAPTHEIYDDIIDYFLSMGISPQKPLTWMWSAFPEEMYEATPQEVCATGLATWVQRVC